MGSIEYVTDPGKVLGVYFHSVAPSDLAIIWQVNFLPVVPEDGETQYYFVVADIDATEAVPDVQAQEATITAYAKPLAIWELAMRLKNPLLQKLEMLSANLVILRVTEDRIVRGAEAGHPSVTSRALTCAYLYCEASLTYQNAAPTFAQSREFWHGTIYREAHVSDIEVFLKTTRGLYECHSAARPVPKKEKAQLAIHDVFVCKEYRVSVRGASVLLLVAHSPQFHAMWANPACQWNGALPEFFRALHCKLFVGRHGVPPTWMYIFPGEVADGTPFGPHLPSFPCLPIRYGTPARLDKTKPWTPSDPRILLHFDGLRHTPCADCLLCGGTPVPPGGIDAPLAWSAPITDVNIGMCETHEHTVALRDPHGLVIINLEAIIGRQILWGARLHSAPLDVCLKLGSPRLGATIMGAYNRALSTVLAWIQRRRHRWVAIHRWQIFLIIELAVSQHWDPEFADLCLACHLAGFPIEGGEAAAVEVASLAASLYTTAPGYFLHARRLDSAVVDCIGPDATWVDSLAWCVSRLLLHPERTSPLQAIEEVIPHYFMRRRQTKFWLVPRELCRTEPVCPPLPVDCLEPRWFLVTKAGPVCWHADFPLPVNVDYVFYLGEVLRVLLSVEASAHATPDAQETTLLEDWNKVLSLF
ncbi:ORF40 [Retroperitoneal fibromatosis-associated herpesvirus]|uniref:ORF40 n=1 Tax=Retroperitoneal fibromatosis-associated herpesvirus TaxID=111469 RepID=U5NM11_9GAMA|nr:ORF40 [Retroperitoneal fibromatosis-associated herpesvirus]AGY30722.1 ORF40 [Retroperitoneal fibromatosis-associated herpesvirus]